ncbi:MAG: polysaccharide biosynthesis tyrosine autokinase [Verrucomicrobiota bacterium]
MQRLKVRWYIPLIVTLLFAGVAVAYTYRAERIYRATAILEAARQEQNLVKFDEVNKQDLGSPEVINTIIAKINSETVMLRVAKSTNVLAALAAEGMPPQAPEALAARFRNLIKPTLRRNTRLIELSAEHPSPAVAQALANSVGAEFIRQASEDQKENTRQANLVLEEESLRLKEKMEQSERKLQDYREGRFNKAIQDGSSSADQDILALNQEYAASRSERRGVEIQLQKIREAAGDYKSLLSLPSIKSDPDVRSALDQFQQQQLLVSSYASRYKPKYPKMIAAVARYRELEIVVSNSVASASKALDLQSEFATAREKTASAALDEARKQSMSLGKLGIEETVLQREVDSDRSLYDSVNKRMKEIGLSAGIGKSAFTLIETASRPLFPYKPNPPMIIGGASLAGLLLGIAIIYMMLKLDHSVNGIDEAELLLGLPVLAAIPRNKTAQKRKKRLVTLNEPHSTASEAFRSLRASAMMSGTPEQLKRVLVTSANAGEGKTFTSSNLAITLAQQGRKTVIIDLDLRRPAVGMTFDIPMDQIGASNYLSGKARFDELLFKTSLDNLFVIPAGPRAVNPAELLNSPVLKKLIDEAAREFDFVVLDTAPINAVSDTLYVLPEATAILLVLQTGKTPVRAVQRALLSMERAGSKAFGAILNRIPEASGYGYYYYRRDEHYGSKGVYGATK